MRDGHWHFQCPECGMGDFELGHLATDQELFCEVCMEEQSRLILLERWPTERGSADLCPLPTRFGRLSRRSTLRLRGCG